jgi:diaminopimelate epimerase
MKDISFYKYTSNGNNFVIVDETQGQYLTEDAKSKFACQVTNVSFGVGADGVIFLQSCRPDILREINTSRRYWDKLPILPDVDMMFRLFEPNGVESFSCGNGLMCVASYLNYRFDISSLRILTQIPRAQPKAITIGTNLQDGTNWANLGHPHRVPNSIVDLAGTKPLNADIDILSDLTINFRMHDLHPFSNDTSLNLSGYLVYTGEPHFVIFTETGFSIANLKKVMFVSSFQDTSMNGQGERRIVFGSWLIHHVGTYLNKRYHRIFPNGINVDFVHIPAQKAALEYRCYERGINKETLACGTGALAVSFVARQLDLIQAKQITVWPHRCRWHDPDAAINVSEEKNSWFIYAKPRRLMEGIFFLDQSLSERLSAVNYDSENHEHFVRIQEETGYHPTPVYH